MLAPVLEIILIQTESLTEHYQLPKNIFVTVSKAIVTKQRQAVHSQLLSPSSKVYVFKKYIIIPIQQLMQDTTHV